MKRISLRLSAVVSIITLLLALAGCTALPGTNGPLTLKQTQIDVSWKMTAYQQAYTAGSTTEAQSQRVNAAHQAYEKAFQQALADAGGNLNAPTPPNLQAVVQQLIAAVDDVLSTL